MPDQTSVAVDAQYHRIAHDIRHQFGTVKLLASLLPDAGDVGPLSRHRARLLVVEMLWLEKLVNSSTSGEMNHFSEVAGKVRPIRIDYLVADILQTARLNTCTRIRLEAVPAHVDAPAIALGRAIRNIVWNGLEAAGPGGELVVRMVIENDTVVLDISDDGPGLAGPRPNGAGLGLQIVREAVAAGAGQFRIDGHEGGGCSTRVTLPLSRSSEPLSEAATLGPADSR